MRTLTLLLFSLPCFAQGWTALSHTAFNTVSAPNNFAATFGGHNMPTCSGIEEWCFADNNFRIISQWGDAWVDTKRNRICYWGGGHNGPDNNSITCLDLQTVSTSVATCGGQTCKIYSNCGGSPCNVAASATVPTMTRINDPSVFAVGCPNPATNYDGTPLSQQDYGALIYLPKHDKYWMSPAATSCPTDLFQSWWWDPAVTPSASAWTLLAPRITNDNDSGLLCALNPTTVHETVWCLVNGNTIDQYDADTNSWSHIANGTLTVPNGASVVIDPDRQLFFIIGAYGFPQFSTPSLWSVSLKSPFTATNLSSSVTGCTNLMAWPYNSLQWDPSIHRIVGYVPQLAAAKGTANNEVTIFDPATMTCVAQPLLPNNGPAASGHVIGSPSFPATQGTQRHFALLPALGVYVWLNDPAIDTYTFKLNNTPVNGLGTANSLTCIDQDGDGYGVGQGCTGPDADDLDAAVHSNAQLLTKWSTLTLGLKHLGYSPANIWYISPAGNDGTGAVNNINLPFLTCCGGGKANPAPGDAVIYRSGTYHDFVSPPSGSIGLPIIFMSMPGEVATFTSSGGAADGYDISESQVYVVIDGAYINGSGASNACVLGAENTNIIMRHIETANCAKWGLDLQGDTPGTAGCPGTGCRPLNDITVQNCLLHDSVDEHGFYFSSHEDAISTNIFVQKTVAYNNPRNGFHLTGQFSNVNFSQLLTYSNLLSGYSWQNGTSNSFLSSVVSLNDDQGVDLTLYDGSGVVCNGSPPYPLGTVCPWPQNNNVISNLSVYLTGENATGGGNCSMGNNACAGAIIVARQAAACTTTACLAAAMTGNIIQNVALQVNNSNGGSTVGSYAAIQFPDSTGVTFLPNTIIRNITVRDNFNTTVVANYGPGSSFGYAPLTCSGLLAVAAAGSGSCNAADPLFTSVNTAYWATPNLFDLRLQSTSTALGAGTATLLVSPFDVNGSMFTIPAPNNGAYAGSTGGGGGAVGLFPTPVPINH